MKRKTIVGIFLLSLFAIMFITAGAIEIRNTTTKVETQTKTFIDNLGSNKPQSTENCYLNFCEYSFYKILDDGRRYGLGSVKIPTRECTEIDSETSECLTWYNFTDAEMNAMLEDAEPKNFDDLVKVQLDRESRSKDTKLGDGEVTLTDK